MTTIKLKEQIVDLRKQKGVTQEELAKALGVTNQAVSKWESGQCCPDIQLLPALAEYFGVSVDTLLGCEGAQSTGEELIHQLRDEILILSSPEDYKQVLKLAFALHAIIWSKEMQKPGAGNPGWDMDEAIRHASVGEWGLSCITSSEITAYMRSESVFFSGNKNLRMDDTSIRYICGLLKDFSDRKNLKIMTALYNLTLHSEGAFVSKAQIAEESGFAEELVEACLGEGIEDYLAEKWDNGETKYRIQGRCMQIIPLLSMLSINV